jgi:hypothetical protein
LQRANNHEQLFILKGLLKGCTTQLEEQAKNSVTKSELLHIFKTMAEAFQGKFGGTAKAPATP